MCFGRHTELAGRVDGDCAGGQEVDFRTEYKPRATAVGTGARRVVHRTQRSTRYTAASKARRAARNSPLSERLPWQTLSQRQQSDLQRSPTSKGPLPPRRRAASIDGAAPMVCFLERTYLSTSRQHGKQQKPDVCTERERTRSKILGFTVFVDPAHARRIQSMTGPH